MYLYVEAATFVQLFSRRIFFFFIFFSFFIGCVVCLQPTQVRSSYLLSSYMDGGWEKGMNFIPHSNLGTIVQKKAMPFQNWEDFHNTVHKTGNILLDIPIRIKYIWRFEPHKALVAISMSIFKWGLCYLGLLY